MKQLLENWRKYLDGLEVDCEQDGVCIVAAEEIVKKLLSDGVEDFKVIEAMFGLMIATTNTQPSTLGL